jgi:hypothetical protein
MTLPEISFGKKATGAVGAPSTLTRVLALETEAANIPPSEADVIEVQLRDPAPDSEVQPAPESVLT